MNIVCPNCHTSFKAEKEQIGIGRKVRCSKCQHVWHQRAKFNQQTSPIIPDHYSTKINSTNNINKDNKIFLTKGINLPALRPISPSNKSYTLLILWFSLIVLLSLLLFHEKFNIPALYKINNNALTIDNIHIEQNKESAQITLSYKITNIANYDVTVPLIRVRLLDQKRLMLKSYIMNQKNIKLLPQQHINITTHLDTVPSASTLLNIMLGNSLDFILY